MKQRAWRRGVAVATLAVAVVVAVVSGALALRPGGVDRLANPRRYATTGADRLAADRYAVAALAYARPGERVAWLAFRDGSLPVTVALTARATAGRTLVYLDPPTARVLDLSRETDAPRSARPAAATRLTAAEAGDRAAALTRGAVRQLIWPTERKPDWLVDLQPDGGDAVTVAVADDGLVAVVLPAPGAERSH